MANLNYEINNNHTVFIVQLIIITIPIPILLHVLDNSRANTCKEKLEYASIKSLAPFH